MEYLLNSGSLNNNNNNQTQECNSQWWESLNPKNKIIILKLLKEVNMKKACQRKATNIVQFSFVVVVVAAAK